MDSRLFLLPPGNLTGDLRMALGIRKLQWIGMWMGGLTLVALLVAWQAIWVLAQAPTPTALTTAAADTTTTPNTALITAAVAATTTPTMTLTTVVAVETPTLLTPTAVESPSSVTPTLTVEPTTQPTATLRPTWTSTPQPTWTSTPQPTSSFTPSPTQTPTPTPIPAPPSKAHTAVLISDTALPTGGVRSSDVFVSLQDVEPGVRQIDLRLSFDPAVVQVVDADENPANGVQVAVAPFWGDSQQVKTNRVNNQEGQIDLTLAHPEGSPTSDTGGWRKVAMIAWLAIAEGKSVVAIAPETQFVGADKVARASYASYNGTVFVRAPGKIKGIVHLQGRAGRHAASISAILVAARVDRAQTGADGAFAIQTTHGEGFYTLVVFASGYLTAESDHPLRVTMDNVADAGELTLLGGDANGDNRIDVRDLSFVAWHFGEYDPAADINADGRVDISDLTLTAGNFGRVGPIPWPVSEQGQ